MGDIDVMWDVAGLALGWATIIGILAALGVVEPSVIAPLQAAKDAGWQWTRELMFACAAGAVLPVAAVIFNPFRKKGEYGQARWATEADIRKAGLRSEAGVILGSAGGKWLRYDAPLSSLLFAPPGTGKTASILIPSLLSCPNSTITHDFKEELWKATAGYRSKFGRAIKFDPAGADSHCWNPLGKNELPANWDDCVGHIDRIAATLYPSPKGSDDHWAKGARMVFAFFALEAVWRHGETSLPEIRSRAMSDPDVQSLIASIIEEEDCPQRMLEDGNRLAGTSAREFSGQYGNFVDGMAPFADPRIARRVSASDFALRDLRSERMSVYLVVRPADAERLSGLVSLFFELANMALMERLPTDDEYGVTFYVDEMQRLRKLRELIEMPAIGRGYRLNAVFACQTLAQLRDIYGQDAVKALLNTCAYTVVFRQTEEDVAKLISESIGNQTRTRRSRSRGKGGVSHSESEEGHPLVSVQDVKSLRQWRTLVLAEGAHHTPIRGRGVPWFKDGKLRRLVSMAPPAIDTQQEAA